MKKLISLVGLLALILAFGCGRIAPPAPATIGPPGTIAATAVQVKSCTAADGTWRCLKLAKPHVLAASTQPIIPISWAVPAWFIDPVNVSATASDTNDCVTSATACLTYQEINTHRWGCLGNPVACPRLRQNTTITYLSAVTTANDPVYFTATMEVGTWAAFVGSLPAGTAGILSNVTAGGGSTRTALWLAQVSAGVPAAGSFLVNTTHPSAAWAVALSSGSIWQWSQPTTRVAVPSTPFTTPTEVVWANGDSVTLYAASQIPAAAFARITPTIENSGTLGGLVGGVYTQNMMHFAENSGATELISGNVQLLESELGRIVSSQSGGFGGNGALETDWYNNYGRTYMGIGSPMGTFNVVGGAYASGVSGSGMTVDGDAVIGVLNVLPISGGTNRKTQLGNVYVRTAGSSLNISATTLLTGVLWGPATMVVNGDARLGYPSGAGGAVAAITLNSGSFLVATSNKACLEVQGSSLTTFTCNLSTTAATLDANLGTTSGCFINGNAAICNFGPGG